MTRRSDKETSYQNYSILRISHSDNIGAATSVTSFPSEVRQDATGCSPDSVYMRVRRVGRVGDYVDWEPVEAHRGPDPGDRTVGCLVLQRFTGFTGGACWGQLWLELL